MLLFLSLADSTKDEPNENYARELMELFTLGKGYTENDIREAARALTGFRSKRRGDGSVAVLYDAKAHDTGAQDDLRPARQASTTATCSTSHRPPAARAVPRLQAVGLLRRRRRSSPARASAWRGIYRALDHADRARRARDPRAPGAVPRPRRARHGQVAGRPRRRRAARDAASGDHARRLGLAARRHGPAPVPPAVGRGLGLGHRLAVDEHDARALRRSPTSC